MGRDRASPALTEHPAFHLPASPGLTLENPLITKNRMTNSVPRLEIWRIAMPK